MMMISNGLPLIQKTILFLTLLPVAYSFTALPFFSPRGSPVSYLSAVTDTGTTSAAEAPAIVVSGLTCTHDGGDTYQLSDVSYNLPRGGKIALLGRNGAGKSTFLRILAESTCYDHEICTANMGMKYTGKISHPRDVRVAYVEQEPPLFADVTVADALLGIRGTIANSESSTKNNNTNDRKSKSVYAVVRQYKAATENVVSDRKWFVMI
jgi:ATPase subunit of ABC transporter with duplicated ATPase domains